MCKCLYKIRCSMNLIIKMYSYHVSLRWEILGRIVSAGEDATQHGRLIFLMVSSGLALAANRIPKLTRWRPAGVEPDVVSP